jgi:4-cresol dehydrogenase (hydroxylating)
LRLPTGLDQAAFDSVCADLRKIVGETWVMTAEDRLSAYDDPYSPGLTNEFLPSGAVSPASVDEIKAVLKIAAQYRVPFWSISLGRNYAYGGAAPCLSGSMILDLSRMQAIEANEELAYATVEPGVTYVALYKFLQDKKLKLWIDCTDPGWGSVLGNALERGVGYTPFGDHAAQLCGLEVVLANGEVIRTGMGAMEGNRTWPLYKGAFGPSLDGLFLQSNFGVVTKAGIWLMPEPDSFSVVELTFPREDDIVDAVDALRALRLDGTVSTATIANWMRLAAANTTRAEWHDGQGAMPKEAIEKLIEEMGIGHWNMRFGLYGRPKVVAENLKAVQKAFSKIEHIDFAISSYRKGESVRPEHRTLAGIPSVELMPLNWLGGAGAHIECPPVVPMIGKEVLELYRRRTELFNAHGFDHYCGFTTTSPRCFINTGSIIFDRNDASQCTRARELGAALIEDAKAKSLGGYRGHISEMDLIAKQFDFNDHAAMRVSEQLKDCLDPEGILSPGKQGIWPKRLREAGKGGDAQ